MARVTLERLTKLYGEVRAVDDVSLEIREGEFVTLVGPSGCGKSTTLYCIAGLERPTSGNIIFDDVPVTHLSPRDRDVAMVFQDYALYPHMSVYDNMAFSLQIQRHPPDEIRARVQEAARVLGLEHLLHRRPAELSGGQRQRVALGRAIVRDPTVFLMDEPLSNLDAALRVRTRTEIKKLQRDLGITTIFVTHDQEEAMVLSDRIAVMNHGRVEQFGPPQELYRRPANLYVAGLIGSPAMNRIAGRLALAEGAVVLAGQGVTVKVPAQMVPPAVANAASSGTPAVLGIRPEDLAVGPTKGAANGLVATVMLAEPVGPVTHLDLELAGQVLKASVSPDLDIRPGEQVALSFSPQKLHFFHGESGQRL